MNLCRRISIASSGSFHHLWWKKFAAPTVAAPPFSTRVRAFSYEAAAPPIKPDPCDEGASSPSAEKKVQWEKRKVYQKLKSLTVETIDLIIKDEEKKGVLVTQEDLVMWAKRLKNIDKKPENALEIFRWMDKKKIKFSPIELAIYVDLIAEAKGYKAAAKYLDKVDPGYNKLDPNAENRPAILILDHWFKMSICGVAKPYIYFPKGSRCFVANK